MTTADAIWQEFHADGNRVEVKGDQKVRLYFAQLSRALGGLHRAVEQSTSTTNAESRAVDRFVLRLRRTLESLALRHFFSETGRELKIDTSESGFPHFSALLELAGDLEHREAGLSELPSMGKMKRSMLDEIVGHSRHPRDLQVAMLRRTYLDSLESDRVFSAFTPGVLERVGGEGANQSSEKGENRYFWSFAQYDRALNRPFVYLIYFHYDDVSLEPGAGSVPEACEGEFAEVVAAAQSAAAARTTLLAFSQQLDAKLVRMRPQIIKRLGIGPFHSPIFTRGEGELGELLAECRDRLPFACEWENEILISDRETRVGSGWLSKGQLRQVFWIPKSIDVSTRGVSQVERYVLLPHWLAQQAHERGLLPDHRHLLLDSASDGRVHGLD